MVKDANHTADSIPWLNETLLERSSIFCRENFLGLSLATFYSAIELFSIKSTTSVLMCSGTVRSRETAGIRALRTFLHMRTWTTAGMSLLNPKTVAYEAINSVRHKHYAATYLAKNRTADAVEFMDKHVLEPPYKTSWKKLRKLAEAIRDDLEFVDTSDAPQHILDWDTPKAIGQFDLGVVQFIISCHVIMHPKEFGIYEVNHADILAFIHNTAVFGRILGIEDKFNVALNLPLNMYDKFYRNIVVASLKNIDEHVLHVMDITVRSASEEFLVPETFRLKCWMYHALKSSVDNFKGKNILALMSHDDKICLRLLDISMSRINKIRLYNLLGEAIYKKWMANKIRKYKIIFP